jgi:Uma2 family endonuclease
MPVESLQPESRVVLHGIPWSTFEALLAASDNRGARFTYDQGNLEIMSPSDLHERVKRLLGRMIETATVELNIPIRSGGSTTLRNQLKARGLEPDECYYVANEPAVRGRKIDLTIDPPPDLAVEVDISTSSLDQLKIYATLGVPEVWTCDGVALKVFRLQPGGDYARQARSPTFPFLPLEELERFLARRDETDETTWIRSFRAWIGTLPT